MALISRAETITPFYGIEYSLKITIEYSQMVSLDLKCQNDSYYFVFIKTFEVFSINFMEVHLVALTELFYFTCACLYCSQPMNAQYHHGKFLRKSHQSHA